MVHVPRALQDRLEPETLEAADGLMSLTGGLSEGHLISAPPRLIAFLKTSAIGPLEKIELDPARPPRIDTVQWQDAVVFWDLEGERHHLPMPTSGGERVLGMLGELLAAMEAWETLRGVLARQREALRDRYKRARLTRRLAEVALELGEVDAAASEYAELLELDPRDAETRGALEAIAEQSPVARDALERAYRGANDWEALIAAWVEALRGRPEAEQVGRWVEIADLFEGRMGAHARAADALGEALALGHDAELLARLDALVSRAHVEAAGVEAWTKALAAEDAPRAHLWLSIAAVEAKRDAEAAAAAWEAALEADPEALPALTGLAGQAKAAEDWLRYVELESRAAALCSGIAARRRLLELAAIQRDTLDDLEGAVRSYERVLARSPLDGATHGALEALYPQLERWEPLFTLLHRRYETSSDLVEREALIHRLGALAEEQLGDTERAIRLWESALELDPKDAPALAALDRLYTQTEQWHQLARVLERLPKDLSATRRLGRLYSGPVAHTELARDAWERLLLGAPGDREALEALLLLYEGHPEACAKLLAELLAVVPAEERLDVQLELARLLQGAGWRQRATEAWRLVLGLDPNHAEAMQALLELHLKTGDLGLAADVLVEMVALAEGPEPPFDPLPLWRQLADLRAKLHQPEHAAAALDRVVALEPTDDGAWNRLVRLYTEGGEWKKLLALYNRRLAFVAEGPARLKLLMETIALAEERAEAPAMALELGLDAVDAFWTHGPLLTRVVRLAMEHGEWAAVIQHLRAGGATPEAIREVALTMLRTLEEKPDYALAWFLGQLLEAGGIDKEAAARCYQHAITVEPRLGEPWERMRVLLREEERWGALSAHLDKMGKAPLPDADKRDAVRELIHVYRVPLASLTDAKAAQKRLRSLENAGGWWLAVALTLIAGGVIVWWVLQ